MTKTSNEKVIFPGKGEVRKTNTEMTLKEAIKSVRTT